LFTLVNILVQFCLRCLLPVIAVQPQAIQLAADHLPVIATIRDHIKYHLISLLRILFRGAKVILQPGVAVFPLQPLTGSIGKCGGKAGVAGCSYIKH
jgi:hypothetical protein